MAQSSQADKNWFVIYSIAFIFGIIWVFTGESDAKIVYIAIAFVMFLRAGITLEMNERARNSHGAH